MNVVCKVGIRSCRGARKRVSFVHVCMYVAAEQTHSVYNINGDVSICFFTFGLYSLKLNFFNW